MSVDNLLSHLDKVRKTGPNRWSACCPAHDDKGPSLVITEKEPDFILLKCFAGCSAHEVVAAVGLDIADLFPTREKHHCKPERRPFPAADILRAVAFESIVVATAGAALLSGEPFTDEDRERLMLAVSRIQSGLTAGGLNHG